MPFVDKVGKVIVPPKHVELDPEIVGVGEIFTATFLMVGVNVGQPEALI